MGTFRITNDDDSQVEFDLSSSKGIVALENYNSSSAIRFDQVTGLARVVVENVTNVGASDTIVEFQDAVVAGKADSVDVSLVGGNVNLLRLGQVSSPAGNTGVEAVNLTTSGGVLTLGQLDSDIKVLNIYGSGVTIISPLNQTISVVNAANIAGPITLSVLGALGSVDIISAAGEDVIVGSNNADRISSGAGADTITGGAGTDSINAGAGSDVIVGADAGDMVTVVRIPTRCVCLRAIRLLQMRTWRASRTSR